MKLPIMALMKLKSDNQKDIFGCFPKMNGSDVIWKCGPVAIIEVIFWVVFFVLATYLQSAWRAKKYCFPSILDFPL